MAVDPFIGHSNPELPSTYMRMTQLLGATQIESEWNVVDVGIVKKVGAQGGRWTLATVAEGFGSRALGA